MKKMRKFKAYYNPNTGAILAVTPEESLPNLKDTSYINVDFEWGKKVCDEGTVALRDYVVFQKELLRKDQLADFMENEHIEPINDNPEFWQVFEEKASNPGIEIVFDSSTNTITFTPKEPKTRLVEFFITEEDNPVVILNTLLVDLCESETSFEIDEDEFDLYTEKVYDRYSFEKK